jgi:hypothetical protein
VGRRYCHDIPRPARFAIHKLVPAQRRGASDRIKRAKDLDQARALLEALRAHDPFALEGALEDARTQGKTGWSDRIDRSPTELAARGKG